MDSLTHTVLGACLGEVIAGKKIGKKAMLLGAIAQNLPDIDVVTALWMDHPDSLLAHRGFTHSFAFFLLASPLLASWFRKRYAATAMTYKDWLILWGSGIFIHLFIDSFTVYGTGWFEPFSHYRVALNILFVADPFYTIALLISCIALMVMKITNKHRFKWAKGALIISTLYVGYAVYNKAKIDNLVNKNFEEQSIVQSNYFSTPTPLNNFLWYIVANTKDGYLIAYHSVFEKSSSMPFTFLPRQDSLLLGYEDDAAVQKLIRFSAGYYTLESMNDTLLFNDLRFGQIGDWNSAHHPFVFRYYINKDIDSEMLIQKGRIEASGREGIRTLIERIKAE